MTGLLGKSRFLRAGSVRVDQSRSLPGGTFASTFFCASIGTSVEPDECLGLVLDFVIARSAARSNPAVALVVLDGFAPLAMTDAKAGAWPTIGDRHGRDLHPGG